MNIAELKEIIKDFPDDAEVLVVSRGMETDSVKEISIGVQCWSMSPLKSIPDKDVKYFFIG